MTTAAAAKLRALDARIDLGLAVDPGEYIKLEAEARLEQRQAEAADRRRAQEDATRRQAERDAAVDAARRQVPSGLDRLEAVVENVVDRLVSSGRTSMLSPGRLRGDLADARTAWARVAEALHSGPSAGCTPARDVRNALQYLRDDASAWHHSDAVSGSERAVIEQTVEQLQSVVAAIIEQVDR